MSVNIREAGEIGKWKVEWSYDGTDIRCEWDPGVPLGQLRPAEVEQYREIRRRFHAKIAEHIGAGVLVVEA